MSKLEVIEVLFLAYKLLISLHKHPNYLQGTKCLSLRPFTSSASRLYHVETFPGDTKGYVTQLSNQNFRSYRSGGYWNWGRDLLVEEEKKKPVYCSIRDENGSKYCGLEAENGERVYKRHKGHPHEDNDEPVYCSIIDKKGFMNCGLEAEKGELFCKIHKGHPQQIQQQKQDVNGSANKRLKIGASPAVNMYCGGFGPSCSRERRGG